MFWRRKTSDATSSGGGSKRQKKQSQRDGSGGNDDDDLAKLQRQFGIKPVSDADVHAEFSSLFRATTGSSAGAGASASGLSPRSELLLFGGSGSGGAGDDDDEASILRALNLSGANIDQIDIDALSDDDDDNGNDDAIDDGGAAKRELRHVLRDAHTTAAQNESKCDPLQTTTTTHDLTRAHASDVATRVRELKLAALARKREGNVPQALALLREAKELEAQAAAGPVVTAAVKATVTVAALATAANDDGHDDDTVDVTDDDMTNPEYLAQLAAMGLVTDDAPALSPRAAAVAALETRIEDAKQQAVQHKRRNEIELAIQLLRTAKGLETQLAALRTSAAVTTVQTTTTTSTTTTTADTVDVAHACTTAADDNDNDDDDDDGLSDADVSDSDMNDPAFAAELSTLGFDASNAESSAVAESRPGAYSRAHSIDDEDLIDAFEDADSDVDDSNATTRPTVARVGYSVLSAPVPSMQPPAKPPSGSNDDIAALTTQLVAAKASALQHKRDGRIEDALASMRRVKQIEALLTHRHAQIGASLPQAPVVQRDPAAVAQFHALEQLLVDFGNRALASAKEMLAVDRTRATEWLNKRKEYAAALDELRAKRIDPLQMPPQFRVEHTTRDIEVELPDVAADEVVVQVHAVHDLRAAAGRDVVVRFCLNFPSSAPHDGRTAAMRVAAAAPHSTGPFASSVYRFPLQRSRGTQRLFEIKKAVFEVWTASTFLRSSELLARGYQELTPFLSTCQVHCRVPFVGSNRKPTGGSVEVSMRLRTPLREKEMRTEIVDELRVEPYPPPALAPPPAPTPTAPVVAVTASSASAVATTAPTVSARASRGDSIESLSAAAAAVDDTDDDMDPHHPDLIVSYDVINEELAKIEAKLPTLSPASAGATELRDRLDSLALKKQLLEIAMETGTLTLDMYVAQLHARVAADRQLIATLLRTGRRRDAARVLHRIKVMENELVGTAGDGQAA